MRSKNRVVRRREDDGDGAFCRPFDDRSSRVMQVYGVEKSLPKRPPLPAAGGTDATRRQRAHSMHNALIFAAFGLKAATGDTGGTGTTGATGGTGWRRNHGRHWRPQPYQKKKKKCNGSRTCAAASTRTQFATPWYGQLPRHEGDAAKERPPSRRPLASRQFGRARLSRRCTQGVNDLRRTVCDSRRC